jgi:branched-chain amino acid transport system substrate-binding protein
MNGLKWALCLAAAALLPAAALGADYDLHVIMPLGGGAAFVGKGQQAVLQVLEKSTNKSGGIDGRNLHLIFHDDQTSPQVAVQLATDVLADHPAVILGSSITAMCNAMAPLMQNGPVMYCMSPGIHPVPGSYIFSATVPTAGLQQAGVQFLRLSGWTKIAILSSTDATGQDGDQAVASALALPENAGVKVVEHLHFNPTDVSVAAQIENIKASGAQALIAWTTGAQLVTILKGVVQSGLDIPIVTSSGNQVFEPFAQLVPVLPKHLYMPSAQYPEHDGITKLDPRIEKVQHEMYAALAEDHLKADNSVATAWDPAAIVIAALRKLGPEATAVQIKDYISGLTDYPGVDGIYDFKKSPQRGLDTTDCVLVSYDPKKIAWVWQSEPGGIPLKH